MRLLRAGSHWLCRAIYERGESLSLFAQLLELGTVIFAVLQFHAIVVESSFFKPKGRHGTYVEGGSEL